MGSNEDGMVIVKVQKQKEVTCSSLSAESAPSSRVLTTRNHETLAGDMT